VEGVNTRRSPRVYEFGAGADVAATLGLVPGGAPAVGIGAWLRRHAWSLNLGGRIIDESSAAATGGSVTAWLWYTSAGLCFHRGALAACALSNVGRRHAHGNGFAVNTATTAPYVAVGARGVLDIPIGDHLRLRSTAELAAPLIAVRFTTEGRDVWTAARLNALVSLGLVAIFH
jgi:hypothetical protein